MRVEHRLTPLGPQLVGKQGRPVAQRALGDLAQIGLRLDAAELRDLDERVERCRAARLSLRRQAVGRPLWPSSAKYETRPSATGWHRLAVTTGHVALVNPSGITMVMDAFCEGWIRGRTAKNIHFTKWEQELGRSLDEIRAEYGVEVTAA